MSETIKLKEKEKQAEYNTLKKKESSRFGCARPLLFVALLLLLFTWFPFNRGSLGVGNMIGRNFEGFVTGSGQIISEGREVGSFEQIALHGIGEVILTQSDQESVVIETDENLLPYIVTQVRGDRLDIDFRPETVLNPSDSIKFYISVKEIEGITVDGFGTVISDEIRGEDLALTVDGAGSITLKNLSVETVFSEINGLGSIELVGDAGSQAVEISGSGEYDGDRLESRNAEITIDGLAHASVAVADDLAVNIDGAGSVSYTGSPRVIQSIDGIGRVHRAVGG